MLQIGPVTAWTTMSATTARMEPEPLLRATYGLPELLDLLFANWVNWVE